MELDQTYLQVSDGSGDASLMHIEADRSIGATIIDVDTVVGIPENFIGTAGTLDANNLLDPDTITNFYGHINGADLEIDGFLPGSADEGNTAGQVVIIKPNSFWANLVGESVKATGEITAFAGATAPAGNLICDGSAISRTDYARLFAVIGTTYGSGDGVNTFNLPNLQGRVIVGKSGSDAEFSDLGETGGEKTHLLTGAESGVKAHTHGVNDPGHQHNLFINTFNTFQAGGGTIVPERQPSFTPQNNWMSSATTGITIQNATAANATNAHNNLQPYITLNYIIKT